MQLQYENLPHQITAIKSIVDLFKGEPNHHYDDFALGDNTRIIKNDLYLDDDTILNNLNTIQKDNQLSISDTLDNKNFTVEMETGTGKTFVYFNTILELYQQYGWRKFMIIVPSIAIREGVIQTFNSTKEYFKNKFNNLNYYCQEYNAKKSNQIKEFASSTDIQILVINIQSFENDKNIINQERENGILMDLIKAVNPIVIIDEPQNISSENRKNAIANLNPLFTVGYSATHKENHHKVYSLNPVQAYNEKLVKQISVRSVVRENEFNHTYVELIEVISDRQLKVKLKCNVNDVSGFKTKTLSLKQGDDLYKKSKNNSQYQDGYVIDEIDFTNQSIKFSNGRILKRDDNIDHLKDMILKTQIQETIKEHLEKEKKLNPLGIKVLSLFFIDKVDNYRKDGKFYQWFEELYEQLTGKNANGVHNGYFSEDRTEKSLKTNKDKEEATYNLIMKNKERLLSLDEPVRFIFSHSALKEGWDNPNVFQICTLNETNSIIKKRQEIGRGLRLPVNQNGERIYDEQINILTIIPNESYEEFATKLQEEYENECGIKFEKSNIKNNDNKRTVTYRFDAFTDPLFLSIWNKVNQKTRYQVNFNSDELIKKCIDSINNQLNIIAPKLKIQKANIEQTIQSGIETIETYSSSQSLTLNFKLPNLLKIIGDKTGLTRETLFKILIGCDKLDLVKINPQAFIDEMSKIINRELRRLMVNGIQYEQIDEVFEQSLLFKSYEIHENKYTFTISNPKKTIYNGVLDLDSGTELAFAQNCENYNPQVAFYFKLPKKFKIPTPVGNYNPDWAVIVNNNHQTLYFVAETKNTDTQIVDTAELKEKEQLKITCAKRYFNVMDEVDYQVVRDLDGLINQN